MKILPHKNSELSFEKVIDSHIPARESIVRRYKNAFRFYDDYNKDTCFKKWLDKTSIQEGIRIFPFLTYRGVMIFLMDETSLMCTGTLKSTDGCVTIAHCKMNGFEKVGFESGGNTGSAMTEYAQRSGIETFFFVPEDNLFLLDSTLFFSPGAHLISVKDTSLLKQTARAFIDLFGISHIPEREWRYEASMFRGMFILEYILKNQPVDWFIQTISAAFGPIGIYRVLNDYGIALPRFLGIQQKANSPLFNSWKKQSTEHEEKNTEENLLTKVMYDREPFTYGTYNDFFELLSSSRGDLSTINHQEFYYYVKKKFEGKTILDLLYEKDIHISVEHEDIVERTGLIALAGTIKAIDQGIISEGTSILCSLTSGMSRSDGKAKPAFCVTDSQDISEDYLKKMFNALCGTKNIS
jgi:Threonine synthase